MTLWNDLSALQEAGEDTPDVGRHSMNAADVGRMTDVSSGDAAEAGHIARDDMAEDGDMGIPSNRHGENY